VTHDACALRVSCRVRGALWARWKACKDSRPVSLILVNMTAMSVDLLQYAFAGQEKIKLMWARLRRTPSWRVLLNERFPDVALIGSERIETGVGCSAFSGTDCGHGYSRSADYICQRT
jgi:hypothetical protein